MEFGSSQSHNCHYNGLMRIVACLIIALLVLSGCSTNWLKATPAPKPRALSVEAFFRAVKDDNPETVEDFLKSGFPVNSTNAEGETALHLAAKSSRVNIARILISNKANVNATTKQGSTPINYSTSMGHGDMVQLLVDRGANPNITSNKEPSAIYFAIMSQNDTLLKTLLDKGANPNATLGGNPALYTAAACGTGKALELLLEHRVNPNVRQKDGGETAMFMAARQGKGLVEILLKHGADINIKDWGGKTALDGAIAANKSEYSKQITPYMPDVIKYMRAHGAKTSH